MKLGLCTLSNQEASVETVIEQAAAAGYDGVEIWGKEPHVGDGSSGRCATIRQCAVDHGLVIGVYGSYLRLGTEAFDDELDHELAVANTLDADVIRVWAGDVDYEDCSNDQWEAAVDDLRRLTDAAVETNLAVTVEKHHGTLTSSTDGARRLIEAVDREACGLNWQPSFRQPADKVLTSARELAPLSNNVHMQAIPEPKTADRCLLTEAHFDISLILSALQSAGFDGWVNVEFITDEVNYEIAIAEDRQYLQSVLEKI